MRYLHVEWGRHIVTLTKSLQSLELVDRLIELAVDHRVVPYDSVDRRVRERLGFRELACFIPRSYAEPPIFHGDLLNQNLLQRAYRFQVLLQAGQQTGELSL